MSSPSRLLERSVSSTSHASDSTDDWDRSLTLPDSTFIPEDDQATRTPRNSVLFPAEETTPGKSITAPFRGAEGKRTLSDLLKMHAEKGTECAFTQEEATRVGDVLGQWINSSLSPYEGEQDDYEHFAAKVKDDLFLPSKRIDSSFTEGRQRGMSESGSLSRPPSSAA
ncbi:hypothetical protein MD484_g5286, partial [Candolleomyces efflorescens]